MKQFALDTVRAFISETYVFDQLKSKKENFSLEAIELVYSGNQDLEEVRLYPYRW